MPPADPRDEALRAAKKAARAEARALRGAHAADPPAPSFLPLVEADPAWPAARAVALYLAFGAEPPTADLLAACRATGRRAFVPAWDPAAGRYRLAAFEAGDPVAAGPGGVPEPAAKRWAESSVPDLWLVPGLRFDASGTRLGHGRGHIDRLLAGRRPGAAVLGLAFGWQVSPAPLPRGPFDVPADRLLVR